MTLEVKICGLTNVDDAAAALEMGADYLGFVTYPRSPRAVTVEEIGTILGRLPAGTRAVAVFVNEQPELVERVAQELGLYAVQIHGDEQAADYAGLQAPLWRAVRREGEQWCPPPADWLARRYVVDAAVAGKYGGTGVPVDWSAAAVLAAERPVLLAGGLDPGNVADAVRRVRPAGVDVVSGIERAPGRKDTTKMREFIRNARAAVPGQGD